MVIERMVNTEAEGFCYDRRVWSILRQRAFAMTGWAHCQRQVAFLSTPVSMHGGLICIALRPSGVTGSKLKTRK